MDDSYTRKRNEKNHMAQRLAEIFSNSTRRGATVKKPEYS
jgi:hypothetical protein